MNQTNGRGLLSDSEFALKMIGVPWSNRACSFEQCDCWGVVVLYYRHVAGVEVHHSAGYESKSDFHTVFTDEVVFWRSVPVAQNGGIFVAYEGVKPVHVGLIIDDRALHSRGENGAVRSDRISAVERQFSKVEYMIYAGD